MLGEKRKPTTLYYLPVPIMCVLNGPLCRVISIFAGAFYARSAVVFGSSIAASWLDDKVVCSAEITCAERDLEQA